MLAARYLEQPEIDDLKQLVKHREWTVLLKLFRCLEIEVQQELEGFKTPEDAHEKRGKLQGIRLGVEVVTNLYGGEPRHDRPSGERARQSASSYTGIGIDPNPGDADASAPSY